MTRHQRIITLHDMMWRLPASRITSSPHLMSPHNQPRHFISPRSQHMTLRTTSPPPTHG